MFVQADRSQRKCLCVSSKPGTREGCRLASLSARSHPLEKDPEGGCWGLRGCPEEESLQPRAKTAPEGGRDPHQSTGPESPAETTVACLPADQGSNSILILNHRALRWFAMQE